VPQADAARVSSVPPAATLFASFLGYNPMATLLGPRVLAGLPARQTHEITGRSFFPHLVAGPFHTALVYAFAFAIAACLVAAVASLLRGGTYHHEDAASPAGPATGKEPVEEAHPARTNRSVGHGKKGRAA